jgi:hypothetical protein
MSSQRKRKKAALKKKLSYIFLAFSLTISCFLVYHYLIKPSGIAFDPTPKAAIVDHLSISQPNPNFKQAIQTIINATGLPVDYYPGEEVTVDFYRNLPMHNYKIIIFRVHSTGECTVEGVPPFVVFFTSEEYSNIRHVQEQLDMRLVYVNFPENEPPGYFGITPLFIKNSINGRFNDTIIIAMGCDSLKYTTMAEAFIEKGAKAYIGWNGSVSASHTDKAITFLLQKLIIEKQTIEETVTNTMKEIGPDPTDKSILIFYPKIAASQKILLQTNSTLLDTMKSRSLNSICIIFHPKRRSKFI